MPNTFFGLTIGKSGLYTASSALNTTAHNIANTETEGYCRQVSTQRASKALHMGNATGMIGTGVDVVGVEQVRDAYYDVKYRSNNTLFGEYDAKQYYMEEIEGYFNEIKLEGFTTTFDDMFDSIQELQKDPANLKVRTQMTNYASSLCEYFNYISSNLGKVQKEINFEISNQVSKINSIGTQISQLTQQINTLEVLGGMASDLRDQRNLLVDQLSQIVEVDVQEIPVGNRVGVSSYFVRINGQLLVDTYQANELECVPRTDRVNMDDQVGLYDIVWKQNRQEFNASTSATTGSLAALYAVMEGNDNQCFKGMAEAQEGDTVITLTSEFSYMNDVNRLNIPQSGKITIGNREYEYSGFQVRLNDEGMYEYEFALDSEIKMGTDEITPATENLTGYQYNAVIGQDIDYKGIPYYMAQLNEFVRTFAKAYNDICKEGVDLNGDAGLDFFNSSDPVSGENFRFTDEWPYGDDEVLFDSKSGPYDVEDEIINYGSYYFMTASKMTITNAVLNDSYKVVTASSIVDGVEESDIAKRLMALKDDKMMFRQGTPDSYLQSLVSEVGIDSRMSAQFRQNQEDILTSVTNQRLSVSGVDQDEEAMNLVRFQSAYNLSSKVISVMDQVYDKLINYLGV